MTIFLLMLAAWIGADLYFWRAADRALQHAPMRRALRVLLTLFMLGQISYMLSTLIGAIVGHVPDLRPMIWPIAVYVWHLLVLPVALVGLSISALFRGVRWWVRRRHAPSPQSLVTPTRQPAGRFTRREALRSAAALLPPLATLGITDRAAAEINGFRIRRIELRLPALPSDLDGVTIAHVSDLHIGKFLPRGMAQRVADATNALEADLVAFTGDVLDLSAPGVQPGIDFIRSLHPRSGLVMIEGNHDVMANAERFEGEALAAGLPLLLDAASTFSLPGRRTPIQFLGISWGELQSGRAIGRTGKEAHMRFRMHGDAATEKSIAAVSRLRQPDAFPILLAHHPHGFDPAVASGFPLVLSGHTHGGQIMLTEHIGAGPLRFRYWTGLYRKANSQMVVSNGIGNWFPVRLNAPAEIIHLTLRAAPNYPSPFPSPR